MSFDQMAAQDDEREAVVAYLQKRRLALKAELEVGSAFPPGSLTQVYQPEDISDLFSKIDLLEELVVEIGHSKHHEKTP